MIDTTAIGGTAMKLIDRLRDEHSESSVVRVVVTVEVTDPEGCPELVWESNCDYVGEIHLADWLGDVAEPDEAEEEA